jgi:hypothetical protein
VGDSETRLSARHSELVLLLAAAPDGLTAEQLAVALHEVDGATVTVRVEMSRLRPLLAGFGLTSRPYRLTRPLVSDADVVQLHLTRGRLHEALELYAGPVLPRSSAPGVVAVRDDLRAHLREAVLRHSDVDPLLAYGRTPEGQCDHEVWTAALDRSRPADAAARAEIVARLERIEAEFGC